MRKAMQPLVRLVDDDPTVSESLSFVLEVAGLRVKAYPSASSFLALDDSSVEGCLLLDVRMPEMSGLELQRRMKREKNSLPIVFLSAHGDIEMAVDAVQQGAADFLVKPPQPEKLVEALKRACARDHDRRLLAAELEDARCEWASLTPAEQETAVLIAKGLSSREAGELLGVSEETVRSRRSEAYAKLGARSAVETAEFLHRLRELERLLDA